MSITIEQLGGVQGSAMQAVVRHGEHAFSALVQGTGRALSSRIGEDLLVEMSFERVVLWRELQAFDDVEARISASDAVPGAVMLKGRVHNVIPLNPASFLIDLYLRAGPEFIALDSKELGGPAPEIGTGLELHVRGLCFHLGNTGPRPIGCAVASG